MTCPTLDRLQRITIGRKFLNYFRYIYLIMTKYEMSDLRQTPKNNSRTYFFKLFQLDIFNYDQV